LRCGYSAVMCWGGITTQRNKEIIPYSSNA
jgi:hypothetical protein